MSRPLGVGHAFLIDQADRLAAQGRLDQAISMLLPAAREPEPPALLLVRLSQLLCAAGRAEQALGLVAERTQGPDADIQLITAHAEALRATGRLEQAVAVFEQATATLPGSGAAEQNLAMALCEGHWFAECEASTRRALAKGSDSPDLWLTRARALQGLGELDEAETAYRQALSRHPSPEVHADLAQLIWTRSEDPRLALRDLDAALAARPGDGGLARAKANVLDALGNRQGAYATYAQALARAGADQTLHADAAVIAAWLDPAVALSHGQRAVTLFPGRPEAHLALCQAHLAAGQPQPALDIAESLRRHWPHDQFVMAIVALAWRLMGDPRYADCHDYARLVRAAPLATPPGWSSLEAYLSDLAASLRGLHRLRGHPIGQSLRRGVQTPQCLTRVADPVIQAFFAAIDPPIRDYLASVRRDGAALGRPWLAEQGYRLERAWSVLLRPQGFHVDHLHPKGWISSACHIELPAAVEEARQGWLKFGEPGIPTLPRLPPEHFVKPRPGHLVLFPSYMWHGTVAFAGAESRLSAAMDIIPA